MYDPSMRVLTILEMLQTKERVPGSELAERLEVSPRTVQRYVARLQDLGVPVTSSKGRGASYRLKPSYTMPPLMFSSDEAFAIALGLNALQHIGLTALAPAVVGVESKLERVLPPAIWSRMQTLSAALQLEKQHWIAPVDAGLITELATAIQEHLELEMHYENHQRVSSQRRVRPLGLVRDGGIWFLAAHCLLRHDLRLFRVDRIASVQKTQTPFEPPNHFDVRDFTKEKLQTTPAQFKTEVWLELNPETIPYDLVPPRAIFKAEGGGMTLRCNVNDLERHAARLLEFNCRLEIRFPPEFKTAFRGLAQRAMQVFDDLESLTLTPDPSHLE
jgi:predicted DNA-binding transcriptional regulator YafY